MTATSQPVRVAMIGCGGFARNHLRRMLPLPDRWAHIPVVCEPSPAAYADFARLFEDTGLAPPPNQPDLDRLLADYAGQLDAAFVITPHRSRHDQVVACLEAGLDVLMEKPMTMNVREAMSLIEARDRTGHVLMVAFPASLSSRYRAAVKMRRAGEFGRLLGIARDVMGALGRAQYRHLAAKAGDFGRRIPVRRWGAHGQCGGRIGRQGFAWRPPRRAARQQRAAGRDPRHCDVQDHLRRVRHHARHGRGQPHGRRRPPCLLQRGQYVHADAWGRRMEIQRRGEKTPQPLDLPDAPSAWEQFLAVRAGEMPNPGPAENGLRVVRLWEAITASAAQGGAPVRV